MQLNKITFGLLLAASFSITSPHRCPVPFGVQMPKAEGGKYAKLVVYFLPPFTTKPECRVDFGEAQLQVTVGWVEISGKPETRIDIRCSEAQ